MAGKRAPKKLCLYGHDTLETGFYWSRSKATTGVTYLARRCARCAVASVQRFRARKALKKGAA